MVVLQNKLTWEKIRSRKEIMFFSLSLLLVAKKLETQSSFLETLSAYSLTCTTQFFRILSKFKGKYSLLFCEWAYIKIFGRYWKSHLALKLVVTTKRYILRMALNLNTRMQLTYNHSLWHWDKRNEIQNGFHCEWKGKDQFSGGKTSQQISRWERSDKNYSNNWEELHILMLTSTSHYCGYRTTQWSLIIPIIAVVERQVNEKQSGPVLMAVRPGHFLLQSLVDDRARNINGPQ